MDWDKLKVFYSVADIGSLTHAGTELNLSQSAVSRQISALENEIGSKLFYRHVRGLTLTQAGQILYTTASHVFSELSAVKTRIQESTNGYNGTLKIAVTVAVGSMWLPSRLAAFLEKYPSLNIEFILTDGTVDFKVGEADCAIRFGNSAVAEADIIKTSLFPVSLNIYGAQKYFDHKGKPTSIDDLKDHDIIVFGNQSTMPVDHVNWLLRLGMPVGETHKPKIQLPNAQGILECVREGLGIATLADYIAKDYPDLIQLLPDISKPFTELLFVYPVELAASLKIQALEEFLKNVD